jgi:hypothetical protein
MLRFILQFLNLPMLRFILQFANLYGAISNRRNVSVQITNFHAYTRVEFVTVITVTHNPRFPLAPPSVVAVVHAPPPQPHPEVFPVLLTTTHLSGATGFYPVKQEMHDGGAGTPWGFPTGVAEGDARFFKSAAVSAQEQCGVNAEKTTMSTARGSRQSASSTTHSAGRSATTTSETYSQGHLQENAMHFPQHVPVYCPPVALSAASGMMAVQPKLPLGQGQPGYDALGQPMRSTATDRGDMWYLDHLFRY